MRDAFEAALVDATGNPLVHTLAGSRDAFYNVSEGQSPELGSDTSAGGDNVTVDVSQLTPGTSATLIFRLVNNDGDTKTSVQIVSARIPPGQVSGTGQISVSAASASATAIDFSHLTDVSASVTES